jgi:glycerophosphoryl diester phosphodiesterase
MTITHGGDWNFSIPYDSKPAFEKAYDFGTDAVKGDFRVSSDNIGMVMHSSPIEIYESFDCFHKKVEEQTAVENAACHMLNTTYTFQPVPDMLAWADDRVNFMFCVKESADIPRAISTLIENNATHRAFLEIGVGEMQNVVATNMEGWDQVYYIIEVHNPDDYNR